MTGRAGTPLTESDIQTVRGVSVFAALTSEALLRLLEQATLVRAPPFHLLFEHEQNAEHLVVVAEGTVGLMAAVGPCDSCLIELVTTGQVIGEAGLFDTGRHPLAAQTITEARLILIPAAALLTCLEACPGMRRQMLAFLSARLRVLVRQLAQLKLMTATQRLGGFVLGLTKHQAGPQTIRLACERRVVADMLGMTPECLSRSLRQLRELGVHSQGKRDIVIEYPDRLRAFITGA